MSNSIFDWPASLKRFVRFTTAKAEDVNDALDGLSAGLDTVEANIARSVKLPVGAADQTIALAAGQRAGLLIGFDASGNVTAVSVGGRWRGDWSAATQYAPGDFFRDPSSKNIYAAELVHTSSAIAADVSAGKVRLAIDVAEIESNRTLSQAAAASAASDASTASSKAAEAVGARDIAVSASDAAVAAYDSFDDRYLGPKASDPVTDNDGNPLIEGALYWNTAVKEMRAWSGAAWFAAYLPSTSYATKDYAENTLPLASPTWHFMLNL